MTRKREDNEMRHMIAVYAVGLSMLLTTVGHGQERTKNAGTNATSARREANAAYGKKDYEACAALFESAARSASGRAAMNDYYNAACCYGRGAKLDKSFEMLRLAIDAGYQNVNHMKGDSDLENLRVDPRWEKVLSTIDVPPIRITDNVTTDPAKARFVYDDVHHFMHAMAIFADGGNPTEILEREYFGKATPGLRQFVIKYGLTAESVAAAIKKRPEKYQKLGERLIHVKAREASFRAAFVRFKGIVPQAVFPPTYFLVSDYGGIASGSPDGQLITLERRTSESIDRMETLLVHELFHFQQLVATGPDEFYAIFGDKKTLLGLTIREGAAEFVANRVTGRITQQDALEYVLRHEPEVWARFQPQMRSQDTSGWMWSEPSVPDQPRDVAYAVGFRIVEAFYGKAADKNQAIRDILSVTDYPRLLGKSGYHAQSSSLGGQTDGVIAAAAREVNVQGILRSYVEDFRSDPFAQTPVTFGVRIRGEGGGDWTVECRGTPPGKTKADVSIHRGFPKRGIVYFVMDVETLLQIDRGEISELTASGKARASDVAPVDVDPTPGFNPGDAFWARLPPLRFHFWTRGTPEIARFGERYSRVLHGANASLLYYERGLRTAWMQVKKGQHVNESKRDQVNPFDSMFVITRGECDARIGGRHRIVREGEMLFVPKDVSHEFWNDTDNPCEWLLIMFGPGA